MVVGRYDSQDQINYVQVNQRFRLVLEPDNNCLRVVSHVGEPPQGEMLSINNATTTEVRLSARPPSYFAVFVYRGAKHLDARLAGVHDGSPP